MLPTVAESGAAGLRGQRLVRARGAGRHAEGRDRTSSTPRPTARCNRAEVIEQFRLQGYEPLGGTPEAMNARIKADVARWTKIIRDAGIEPQ